MELTTKLTDRTLRFDGTSEVHPDDLARFLLLGVPPSKLRVTEVTPDIENFNTQSRDHEQILPATPEPVTLSMEWQVPPSYLDLDLADHVVAKFREIADGYTEEEVELGYNRIAIELEEIEKRGMSEFVRTVIYILDELRKKNVVWGVGRGSSCASYVLFLIGLHAVDCVKYDVPMEEFFH